jgi:hyperosmotically inducible periplasmic protein
MAPRVLYERGERSHAMRHMLLVLTVLALTLSPAIAAAGDGAGQVMKDAWVTTKTKMALVSDGRVRARHVAVETHTGNVTLRGKVESAEERAAAEEIARGVTGATAVSNALQIVTAEQRQSVDAKDAEIERAVKERLASDAWLKGAAIKVRSDNSVVTLIGTVPDTKTRARASDVTRGVPGVRVVRNELTQKS